MTTAALTPTAIQDRLDRILLKVEKPGRYVGGEYNQVKKNWADVENHIALVFPDIYDIGLSNLGIMTLYDVLNQQNDILAERAYSPWKDMEKEMRNAGIPLYALESKQPLQAFDIVGISLPYETLYTNALNILDLAQIPLRSASRSEHDPLIIAGGHACYNPEPMAPFLDAIVIGDGEEVILEIIRTVHQGKKQGLLRSEILRNLASLWGVYVPSLYTPQYAETGELLQIRPIYPDIPEKIKKRVVAQLPDPFTNFLVPSIDIVHNRVTIEITRGCTRGCRFCQAGMINRPIRERTVSQITQGIRKAIRSTGYEEVGLLSLSSSDYTHITALVDEIVQSSQEQPLNIALPSLRIESLSLDLLESLKGSRQGGFTLAPEAATESMRHFINKPIASDDLLSITEEIYRRGWQTIKVYFMIGLPDETDEDVAAIAALCKSCIRIGHQMMGKRAALHVSVGTFVPKPHTPFQWAVVNAPEQIQQKQDFLRKQLTGPGIKFNWTDPEETQLEAWLSRGDRRMANVIESAFKSGATFDAWHESDHDDKWRTAFEQNHMDPGFYSTRERTQHEFFPWSILDIGVSRNYLWKEWLSGKSRQLTSDCRTECHYCGIVPSLSQMAKPAQTKDWFCPVSEQRS